MKFSKNTPLIKIPARAMRRKSNAPEQSRTEESVFPSFPSALSFPKARVKRTKVQAITTPPENPPPGVRCP